METIGIVALGLTLGAGAIAGQELVRAVVRDAYACLKNWGRRVRLAVLTGHPSGSDVPDGSDAVAPKHDRTRARAADADVIVTDVVATNLSVADIRARGSLQVRRASAKGDITIANVNLR